jgi:hypothetical protein
MIFLPLDNTISTLLVHIWYHLHFNTFTNIFGEVCGGMAFKKEYKHKSHQYFIHISIKWILKNMVVHTNSWIKEYISYKLHWTYILPTTLNIYLTNYTEHLSYKLHWTSILQTTLNIYLTNYTEHLSYKLHWTSILQTTLNIYLTNYTEHISYKLHWTYILQTTLNIYLTNYTEHCTNTFITTLMSVNVSIHL